MTQDVDARPGARTGTWTDAWAHGWAAARQVPAPAPVPGGWLLVSGRELEAERRVLRSTDGLAEALGSASQYPSWIKLTTADEPPDLGDGWELTAVDRLMVLEPLVVEPALVPDGYRLHRRTDGTCGVVELRHDGRLAARGVVGLAGDVAVPDQVVTEPDHRRRGLGRSVMAALGALARDEGATVAVLVATDDGRRLYEPLGWRALDGVAAYRRLAP